MVEHAVQNDIHSKRMRFLNQFLQILLRPKRRIDLIIIVNVVFVAGIGAEDRRHVDHVHAQMPDVIQTIDDPAQGSLQISLMTDRRLIPLRLGNRLVRGKSGRKDLVDDLVLRPLRQLKQLLLPKRLRAVVHPVEIRDALVIKAVVAIENHFSRRIPYFKKIPETDHIHIQLHLIIIYIFIRISGLHLIHLPRILPL